MITKVDLFSKGISPLSKGAGASLRIVEGTVQLRRNIVFSENSITLKSYTYHGWLAEPSFCSVGNCLDTSLAKNNTLVGGLRVISHHGLSGQCMLV